jgi:photosystem II stability/assembly factor-like uncharacterized protein
MYMKNKVLASVMTILVLQAMPVHGQWIQCFPVEQVPITSICMVDGYIFIAGPGLDIERSQDYIFWTEVNPNPSISSVNDIIYDKSTGVTYILACTDLGLYMSDTYGDSWTLISDGIPNANIITALKNGSTLLASTQDGKYRSTNSGQNWNSVAIGEPNQVAHGFYLTEGTMYAGLANPSHFVYKSTDDGATWTFSDNGITSDVRQFARLGNELFAESVTLLYHSFDGGESWTAVGPGLVPGMPITDLEVKDSYILVATMAGGYVQHTDSINWRCITNQFGTGQLMTAMNADDNLVLAGVEGSGLLGRLTSQVLFAIPENDPARSGFSLQEIYPNPASDNAHIRYQVQQPVHLTLTISDREGKKVQSIEFPDQIPGIYEREIPTHSLSKGIYLFTLHTGSWASTQTVVVVR